MTTIVKRFERRESTTKGKSLASKVRRKMSYFTFSQMCLKSRLRNNKKTFAIGIGYLSTY